MGQYDIVTERSKLKYYEQRGQQATEGTGVRCKCVRAKFIVTYRVNKPLEVALVINKHRVSALMLDLSEDGMALISEVGIPAQTILHIAFKK